MGVVEKQLGKIEKIDSCIKIDKRFCTNVSNSNNSQKQKRKGGKRPLIQLYKENICTLPCSLHT